MVGSSASASCVGGSGGFDGEGTTVCCTGGGGGGGGGTTACCCAGGGGVGGGTTVCCTGGGGITACCCAGGGLPGRGPAPPGMKEKSSASDEETQGTCSLLGGRVTPTRVRFSVSSAIRSGTRISLSNSRTNRLRSPPLSATTEDSAAEYITSVPFGAITGASPAEKLRNRRSNGLRLEASISAILTPAPRLLISPSTASRLKPSRRTSGSVQICASTGIM